MIGEKEIASRHCGYALAYTNCWSEEGGWMMARTADGGWMPWRGHNVHGQGRMESNLWQQGWFVPHDTTGLVRLMDGRVRFAEASDRSFGDTGEDFRWNDAYKHPDEPCHTLPFLFAYSSDSDKVGYWIGKICSNVH